MSRMEEKPEYKIESFLSPPGLKTETFVRGDSALKRTIQELLWKGNSRLVITKIEKS